MNKAWFIDYKCGEWDHSYIVIHAPDKTEARRVLKHHVDLYTAPEQMHNFKINRITEWDVKNIPEDWKEACENGEA